MLRIKFIVCGLLFICGSLHAQSKIENLVFEGAGIRGIAYAGAVRELEDRKLLGDVKRVGGTSAGAITALMLSLGYTATEMETIISQTHFRGFNDGQYLIAGGMHRVKKYFGWYRINRFEEWLEKIITAKTGDPNITFAQLKQRGFLDLYTTGTNLTEQKLELFSFEHSPDMKVKDAVRISMSIPLYFEAVFRDSSGAIVSAPKNKKGLDVLVDGGLVANFPIKIFDSSRYNPPGTNSSFEVHPGTLGFRIDREGRTAKDNQLAPLPTGNLRQYIHAFYSIIIENYSRRNLTPEDWKRTISISDSRIGPRIRRLSQEEITTLTGNGKTAVQQFLERR